MPQWLPAPAGGHWGLFVVLACVTFPSLFSYNPAQLQPIKT